MEKKGRLYIVGIIMGVILMVSSFPVAQLTSGAEEAVKFSLLAIGAVIFSVFLKKCLDSPFNSKYFQKGGHVSAYGMITFLNSEKKIKEGNLDAIVSHIKICSFCRDLFIVTRNNIGRKDQEELKELEVLEE